MICKIKDCGRESITKGYCTRHYSQLLYYGKILNRTKFDKNKIEIKKDKALVHIYDVNRKVIAKAIIDIEDVDKVKKYKWHLTGSKYVATMIKYNTRFYLNNLILNKKMKKGYFILNKNGNKLDCRKNNLKSCVYNTIFRYQKAPKNSISKIKGLSPVKIGEKTMYKVATSYNNKYIYLGLIKDKKTAMKVMDKANKFIIDGMIKRGNNFKLKYNGVY